MNPRGNICKCGAPKHETQFFCTGCTDKLPHSLIIDLTRSQSWQGFRGLIRRAMVILDQRWKASERIGTLRERKGDRELAQDFAP